jgi:hypothetical protein
MDLFKVKFSGKTLERGFWIYVVQITNPNGQKYFYVGMTGDSSSLNAASLFVRIGRHLDTKEKAKGNTLFKSIREEKQLWPFLYKLDFEIIGFYLQGEIRENYGRIRSEISHLEDKLHKDLEKEGYKILGSKWEKNPIIYDYWQKEYSEILTSVKNSFRK